MGSVGHVVIEKTRIIRLINFIYEQLHQYGDRLSDPDPHLAVGSPLAIDHVRSGLEPGHRAYLHLRVTHEYLLAIGELVRARGSFSPLGVEQAVCRTALMAACKALYILEPDSSDGRIRRCATLMLEDERSSLREAKDALKVVKPGDPTHEVWIKLQKQLQEGTRFVDERLSALGLEKERFEGDGSLFLAAGKYLDKVAPLPQPAGLAQSKSVSSEAVMLRYWNQTSGYAHANLWPLMRIARQTLGTSEVTVAGRLDDMLGLLASTYSIFDSAMTLLDQRRTSTSGTPS